MKEVRQNVHACHKHNRDQRNLGPAVHLKLHDERNRKQCKSEVADDTESTVYVGENDDDVDVYAGSISSLVPEVRDRSALQHCNKEKDDAGDDGNQHDAANDPGVYPLDGDSQQEISDRDLCQDHRHAIPDVAKIPVLCDMLIPLPRSYLRHRRELSTNL